MIPKEFLGAFKAGHRRSSREFIDEDLAVMLLKKVQDENCPKARVALEFLTKFNNEFHKNVIKKGDQTALHAKDQHRIDCSRRDNARNRDVFVKLERYEGSEAFYVVETFNQQDEEPEF